MDIVPKLGERITGDQKRDAIHIAVLPMLATKRMKPGQRLKYGIVDPFLQEDVLPGDQFWLLLYPQTITSLRHEWTHPGIDGGPVAESRRWIEQFAARLGYSYSRLMQAARDWRDGQLYVKEQKAKNPDAVVWNDNYIYDNTRTYQDYWSEFPEFWKHYAIVTGEGVPEEDREDCFFACSC